MEILHSAIAILGAIVLIIRFKVDPVISLLLACVYLGLATGLGATGTVEAITGGFGEIMAEVGLLIGFGVLIGALLHAMGTFSDLVEILAPITSHSPESRALYMPAGRPARAAILTPFPPDPSPRMTSASA